MSGERYEQVGWAEPNDTGVGTNRWFFYESTGAPEVMQPVYVKVPDPEPRITYQEWLATQERCPTCGSDNPAVEIMLAHIESEDQLLGFLCGEGRCPDPWHSTAAPDVSASTDQ